MRRPAAGNGLDGGLRQHFTGGGPVGHDPVPWRIPHFLSLVWLCREDYARAGFRMLPLIDPRGHLTCLMIVLYSLALLPLGLAVTCAGLAGYLFGAMSLLLGLGWFLLAVAMFRVGRGGDARRVFLASLVYLPSLMLFMVLDGHPGGGSLPLIDGNAISVGWDQIAERTQAHRDGDRKEGPASEKVVTSTYTP